MSGLSWHISESQSWWQSLSSELHYWSLSSDCHYCIDRTLTYLRFIKHAADPSIQRVISISLFTHPGFLIVDHIHFQYNGFMFGILLWSILKAQQVRLLKCECKFTTTWWVQLLGRESPLGIALCYLTQFQAHIHVHCCVYNFIKSFGGRTKLFLPHFSRHISYIFSEYIAWLHEVRT